MGLYNPIEVSQAAEKAKEMLEQSGQVGRVDRTTTWLFPEQTIVLEPMMEGNDAGMWGGSFTPPGETLPEKLCFAIDDVVHECKKQTMEHNADTVGWYGNPWLFSPDDFEKTQDAFFVMLSLDDNNLTVGFADPDTLEQDIPEYEPAGTTHTLAIYASEETIHPMNEKFLPPGVGGGLETVELETKMVMGDTLEGSYELSEADVALLSAAAEKRKPFILSFWDTTGNMNAVSVMSVMYMPANGNYSFSGLYAGCKLFVSKTALVISS